MPAGLTQRHARGEDPRPAHEALLDRFGEPAIGARADLIAVDGDPLADISLLDGQGEYITHIMKDGAFYKRL